MYLVRVLHSWLTFCFFYLKTRKRCKEKETAVLVAQKLTQLLLEKVAWIKSCTKFNKLKVVLIHCHALLSKKCFLGETLYCIANQLLFYD